MKTLVILISGRGSNMQALLNADLDADRMVVISNNPQAEGLQIAKQQGLKHVLSITAILRIGKVSMKYWRGKLLNFNLN